jgi:hypothetical protein
VFSGSSQLLEHRYGGAVLLLSYYLVGEEETEFVGNLS